MKRRILSILLLTALLAVCLSSCDAKSIKDDLMYPLGQKETTETTSKTQQPVTTNDASNTKPATEATTITTSTVTEPSTETTTAVSTTKPVTTTTQHDTSTTVTTFETTNTTTEKTTVESTTVETTTVPTTEPTISKNEYFVESYNRFIVDFVENNSSLIHAISDFDVKESMQRKGTISNLKFDTNIKSYETFYLENLAASDSFEVNGNKIHLLGKDDDTYIVINNYGYSNVNVDQKQANIGIFSVESYYKPFRFYSEMDEDTLLISSIYKDDIKYDDKTQMYAVPDHVAEDFLTSLGLNFYKEAHRVKYSMNCSVENDEISAIYIIGIYNSKEVLKLSYEIGSEDVVFDLLYHTSEDGKLDFKYEKNIINNNTYQISVYFKTSEFENVENEYYFDIEYEFASTDGFVIDKDDQTLVDYEEEEIETYKEIMEHYNLFTYYVDEKYVCEGITAFDKERNVYINFAPVGESIELQTISTHPYTGYCHGVIDGYNVYVEEHMDTDDIEAFLRLKYPAVVECDDYFPVLVYEPEYDIYVGYIPATEGEGTHECTGYITSADYQEVKDMMCLGEMFFYTNSISIDEHCYYHLIYDEIESSYMSIYDSSECCAYISVYIEEIDEYVVYERVNESQYAFYGYTDEKLGCEAYADYGTDEIYVLKHK